MRFFLGIQFFIGMLLLSVTAWAQQSRDLENVEIEIVKERKITLPEAERKFNKIGPHASEPISPPITYSFKPIEVQLPLANLPIRALKLKREPDETIQRGQFSAGYGNYASPYLEAYLTSQPNSKQLIGAHALMDIWAKGPVDGQNSGNGKYGVSLFANSFGEKIKAGAHARLDQSFWHFYGYRPGTVFEAKDIKQSFNRFAMGGSIANSSVSSFNYQLKTDFGYLADKFDAKETKVDFDFTSNYDIAKQQAVKISAAYQIVSREDKLVNAKPRSLLQLSSLYSLEPIEKLQIDAGFGIAFENDTIDKDFHLYPLVWAKYSLTENIKAKAHLSGQMNSVSMHTLSLENPWLAPNVAIAHTNEALDFGGSIEANVGKNAQAEAGVSIASLRNLYFYVNSPLDTTAFVTLYDNEATERTNLFATFKYSFAQQASALLRADVYGYNTGSLNEAWHRPGYKVSFEGCYNFYEKLKLTAAFVALGGMKAPKPVTMETVTLDPAIDLSLRADYFVSKKFLVFAQAANILGVDYNLYLNYPVRGFQVRAGFSWSF